MKRRSLLKALSVSPLAVALAPLATTLGNVLVPSTPKINFPSSNKDAFRDYIPGPENKRTYQILRFLTQNPKANYSFPVVLDGPVGSGKTHLFHFAKKQIEQNSKLKVRVMSAERFINDAIKALRSGSLQDFRKFHYAHDVLMIDYINILARGSVVQEEFLHLLRHYRHEHKQLYFTADSIAAATYSFEPLVQSRLDECLWLKVQHASLDSKLLIAHNYSQDQGLHLPMSALQKLAKDSATVRVLHGKIRKLKILSAIARNNGSPV